MRRRLSLGVRRLMLIAEAIEFHRRVVKPSLGPPVGAPERDISALEVRLGCKLPLAYREFLLWMGGDLNGLLRGTDCFIGNIETNEQSLRDLLSENDLAPLSYRPVVFFLHQGYIAYWFSMNGARVDPEVFSFNEGLREVGIRSVGDFSLWLSAELSALAEAL